MNTIENVRGRLVGHNTDVIGFRSLLADDIGLQVTGSTALVLGAGGAARAVVKVLSDLGSQVVVTARRPEAAENLRSAGDIEIVAWDDAAPAADKSDLVVNTTPLGMAEEDPLPAASFRAGQTVVDLVYNPPTTPLVERARAAGADAWGGLGMLVHQAAAAFRIWTGQEPPLDVMSAAAIHSLGHTRD